MTITDLLLALYPFYLTCDALKSPKIVKKQQFVEIAQIWHVVATALWIDTVTFGMLPFVDTFKSIFVFCACWRPTRTAAFDFSCYINKQARAKALPIVQRAFKMWPQISLWTRKANSLCHKFTETSWHHLAAPTATHNVAHL